MNMEIREEIKDGVAVITVVGELIAGAEVSAFHARIKELAQQGIIHIVVDFEGVKWFGSAMLGVLAASYATLQSVDGDICLTGVNEKVDSILRVTRLGTIFTCFDTKEEAISSFNG